MRCGRVLVQAITVYAIAIEAGHSCIDECRAAMYDSVVQSDWAITIWAITI